LFGYSSEQQEDWTRACGRKRHISGGEMGLSWCHLEDGGGGMLPECCGSEAS